MPEFDANRDVVLDEAIGACLTAVPDKALVQMMGPAAYYACFADTLRAMKSPVAANNQHSNVVEKRTAA